MSNSNIHKSTFKDLATVKQQEGIIRLLCDLFWLFTKENTNATAIKQRS